MYKFLGLPTREQATKSCPCEKQGSSRLIPATANDWPCALLIVMAKAKRIGNCNRLKVNGISSVIIGIRGMKTSSPLAHPVRIVASMMQLCNFFTQSLVPLQSLGVSKFLKSIIGAPTLRVKLCGGTPGISKGVQKFCRI